MRRNQEDNIPDPNEEETSSDSESSTPRASPTPSVSFGHHICGSLYAKCAEHGRSQLLDTFTNPHSNLSQRTFTKSQLKQKSDAFHGAIRKTKADYDAKETKSDEVKTLPKSEVNKSRDGSVIANKKAEHEKNCKVKEPRIKQVQKTLVRRRNSLPPDQPHPATLAQLEETFSRELYGVLPDQEEISKPIKRERSKSAGKIILSDEAKCEASDSVQLDKESEAYGKCLETCSGYHMLTSPIATDLLEKCEAIQGENSMKVDWTHHAATECLRSIIIQLRKENKQWAHKVDCLDTEILLLRRELKKMDKENTTLKREVSKLRSVLKQTGIFKQEDILSSLQDSHGMPGQVQQVIAVPNPNKKQGVSGESSNNGRQLDQIEIKRYEKDFRSKQLIKDAIMENNFLKNLDSSQVREIVESVYPKEFTKGSYVITEGEAGSHLYVSAEGEFEVIKDHKILGRMGPGKAFGELAILYNCRRTASIKVVSDAKVWVLDRRVFQQIMMKTGLQRLQENINFLRSVPLLQPLSNDVLAKMADVLEVDFYPSGAHIIRQGASGDTFFIISSGRVKVTQQKPGREEEEEIRILCKGDYFGEQALLKEDWRTANVIALSPGVECLTLDRESFIQLIGDLSELQEKNYEDQDKRGFSRPSSTANLSDKEEYVYIRLEDLEIISTLGVGGFGRVELVQYANNKSMTFALKCLKKQHIVDTQQQEHVYSERNIMMACNSPFICRLYRTFRDSKYVYMLLEACLGGEVWTILRERGCFDDYTTRFVTGCVVEAFEYLHARGIIYRDLKPENLLLDNNGYVKIVDFGFSKRIGFSSKTWTFCGTPEYVAPEIILNKGHDRAVDYWSLGILMHELLTGTPPFTASDPMRTYNIILKGIDMINFPKHVTRTAQSLIKRLCRDSPSERLGYQRGGIEDIKKHKWFQGFDWQGLKQRALIPPITPLVRGPTDVSNFDVYSKETDVPPDEFSNWDADF